MLDYFLFKTDDLPADIPRQIGEEIPEIGYKGFPKVEEILKGVRK